MTAVCYIKEDIHRGYPLFLIRTSHAAYLRRLTRKWISIFERKDRKRHTVNN